MIYIYVGAETRSKTNDSFSIPSPIFAGFDATRQTRYYTFTCARTAVYQTFKRGCRPVLRDVRRDGNCFVAHRQPIQAKGQVTPIPDISREINQKKKKKTKGFDHLNNIGRGPRTISAITGLLIHDYYYYIISSVFGKSVAIRWAFL